MALDAAIHQSEQALPVKNATCVLVDDGLVTGATMHAAVDWAQQGGARQVVAAMPVGAPRTVAELREHADEVVCLETPAPFVAVGLHYSDFGEVDDDDVVGLLNQARRTLIE